MLFYCAKEWIKYQRIILKNIGKNIIIKKKGKTMEAIINDDLTLAEYVDKMLEEAENEIKNPNTVFLTHDEVFSESRRIIIDK